MTPAIHRIWVGSEIPAEFRAYGDTWVTHHPDWEHILWTDSEQPYMGNVQIRPLPAMYNQLLYDKAEQFAPSGVGQFKADILRYEILFRYGGIYVDTDFECLKPIDTLVADTECFAAWESQDVWVNNAIMGAVPRHPFIFKLIENLYSNVEANKGRRPNKLSGPQYLTPIYRTMADRVTVFDKKYFYPYLWNELERKGDTFPDAFAVHHWSNARKRAAA